MFARLLPPKYGIAVHNSLTANSKGFETSTTEDQKIVSWINLLNLDNHFNAITKPSEFCGTHYWCELYNKCYHDKLMMTKDTQVLDRIVNLRSDDSGDASDTSSNETDNVIDSGDRNSDDEESARHRHAKGKR